MTMNSVKPKYCVLVIRLTKQDHSRNATKSMNLTADGWRNVSKQRIYSYTLVSQNKNISNIMDMMKRFGRPDYLLILPSYSQILGILNFFHSSIQNNEVWQYLICFTRHVNLRPVFWSILYLQEQLITQNLMTWWI
jgi:hypothetical protein